MDMNRLRLPDHPLPLVGAATYYAHGCDVYMESTDDHVSMIDTKKSNEAALKAAKRWQEKENKAVAKEAKRLAKLGK
jgi:hypothetical protein